MRSMKEENGFDRLLERAAQPRDGRPPIGTCLDAETLAAWTDGSLTAGERTAAEAHAADCDRCLAVLTAIAKTAPPPMDQARPSWFSVRWLVPATMAVAAAGIFVLIADRPDVSREVALSAPSAIDTIAPPPGPVPPTTVAPPSPGSSAREAVGQSAAATPAAKKLESRSAAAERPREEGRVAKDASAARPPVTALPDSAANRTVDSVASLPRAAAAPAPAVATELLQRQSVFAMASAIIATPDPNVRWRLSGPNVDRSIDGGQTWTPQLTGMLLAPVAGAAPDPRVCWLVGPGGLVLLTVDGTTWRRVDFPDATANLVAVIARDGLSATVTTSDGRSYRTDDGGTTWRAQESPAAAF